MTAPVWLASNIEWIQASTGFPDFVNDHGWIWATGEALHFMGLSMLIGTIGALDLRLLGLWKELPIGPLTRLIPWGVAGFSLCLLTGALFVFGNHWTTDAYLNNIAFQWKMGMILLAGVNVMIFNLSGLARSVAVLDVGQSAPLGAKITGASSLVIWVAVIVWGRFLPILGNAF